MDCFLVSQGIHMLFKKIVFLTLSLAFTSEVQASSISSHQPHRLSQSLLRQTKTLIHGVTNFEKKILAEEAAIQAKKLLGEDTDTEEFRKTEYSKGKKIEEFRMLVFIKHLSLEDLSKLQLRLSHQENQVMDRHLRTIYPRVITHVEGKIEFQAAGVVSPEKMNDSE
jgi:hypothetical protein